MSDKNLFDFKSFVLANTKRKVNGFDYLHTTYKAHRLNIDFIIYFAKLFWPDFKTVDGLTFISELFDFDRYQSLLKDGHNAKKAQFWMNLLEITGLFDELLIDEATQIAKAVVASWNSKLHAEHRNISVSARVICDNETEEVFVTIGNPD